MVGVRPARKGWPGFGSAIGNDGTGLVWFIELIQQYFMAAW